VNSIANELFSVQSVSRMMENEVVNPVSYFQSIPTGELKSHYDVVVIGAGMAGLTAAALLVKEGKSVLILERNYLPGGCSSSYFRKGYIFESGATTLVGLDEGMPLRAVLDETGIKLNASKLNVPMQVFLPDGRMLTRYQDREKWIEEAQRVFGGNRMAEFWKFCFKISDFVWNSSMRYRFFPPQKAQDWISLLKNFKASDPWFARNAFTSTASLLKRFGLHENEEFKTFVNEQLMITAQNKMEEVNVLFGATALCYTNSGNYYLPGGMVSMVKAFTDYIGNHGGHLLLRTAADSIEPIGEHFNVKFGDGSVIARSIVSAIPMNNLANLLPEKHPLKLKATKQTIETKKLNSALQMSIVLRDRLFPKCLHYQIHQPDGGSIFLSLSSADDRLRSPKGLRVASISTHAKTSDYYNSNKQDWAEQAIELLIKRGLIESDDLILKHVSGPEEWQQWTGRAGGFVGGYPQFKDVLPWKMNKHQLGANIYTCGDSVYPGQGIPGVVMNGWQVAGRLLRDFK
jgi:C-3',4' desaturase CrtD